MSASTASTSVVMISASGVLLSVSSYRGVLVRGWDVIGFATQPNNTAKEGPRGGNSPYAEALAQFMGVKGLKIFAFFNEVALKVMDATANEQEPWVSYSAIRGDPYINPPEVIVDIPPTLPELQGYEPPTPPPTETRTSASLPFIQLAHKQLDNNDFAAARATLTKGIEADRNSALAYSYRGFAWYLEGLTSKDPQSAYLAYQQGFPDLDVAIKLDPSYAPVRRHRGNTIVATYNALRALRRPTKRHSRPRYRRSYGCRETRPDVQDQHSWLWRRRTGSKVRTSRFR
jgi:Caspase domain